MNIICEKIGEVLKAAKEPMTAKEIGDIIGVTKQTIFNNIPEAIENGYAEDTGKTISRAKLFAYPNHAHKHQYTITWNEKRLPLKDFFKSYSQIAGNLDMFTRPFLKEVADLYKMAADFLDDFNGTKFDNTERIIALKEKRARMVKFIYALESTAKAFRILYNTEELWSPQTFVETLIIKDGDTTPSEIRSILDTYNENRKGK